MRWEDERYVRLYVKDDGDWLMWPWQSRVLFPLLLRKCDRIGVVKVGKHGARALAKMLDIPEDIVIAGLGGLIDDGCVTSPHDGILLVRNYLTAQESPQSDRARKQAQRERERAMLEAKQQGIINGDGPVTKRDNESQNVTETAASSLNTANPTGEASETVSVTNRDPESQNVTDSHETGQNVTNCHEVSLRAVPFRSVPFCKNPEGDLAQVVEPPPDATQKASGSEFGKPDSAAQRKLVDTHRDNALLILGALDEGRKRSISRARPIRPRYSSLAGIASRLDAGCSVDECLHVIAVYEAEVRADATVAKYFDAVTPWRSENFERALAKDPRTAGSSRSARSTGGAKVAPDAPRPERREYTAPEGPIADIVSTLAAKRSV